uniref:DUF4408 domain-containing protein n=1 Tax=Cucumis melo TaxID=3656 RepID=A0A9I9D7J9_CUCME
MGMRIMLGLIPILVVMVLLVTSKSSPCFLLFGSPHFIFSIFNSIVLLITMRNHEEPQRPHEQFEIMDDQLILRLSPYHNKPHHQDTREEDDDDGDNQNTDDQYDNRNEKEDKLISDIIEDEMKEWDEKEGEEDEYEAERWDEEEEDEELEKRIEEFIAKVNKRWREEKLRDHLLIQICSTNVISNTSN